MNHWALPTNIGPSDIQVMVVTMDETVPICSSCHSPWVFHAVISNIIATIQASICYSSQLLQSHHRENWSIKRLAQTEHFLNRIQSFKSSLSVIYVMLPDWLNNLNSQSECLKWAKYRSMIGSRFANCHSFTVLVAICRMCENPVLNLVHYARVSFSFPQAYREQMFPTRGNKMIAPYYHFSVVATKSCFHAWYWRRARFGYRKNEWEGLWGNLRQESHWRKIDTLDCFHCLFGNIAVVVVVVVVVDWQVKIWNESRGEIITYKIEGLSYFRLAY